jgi:hypothetical protein
VGVEERETDVRRSGLEAAHGEAEELDLALGEDAVGGFGLGLVGHVDDEEGEDVGGMGCLCGKLSGLMGC